MRAVVMQGHQLVVDTVPDPQPGPGQVLVKTLACGICGSDLHMLKSARQLYEAAGDSEAPLSMDPSKNIVMGHEFCAEILDYGSSSRKSLAVGSRVCSMPFAIGGNGVVSAVGYSNDFPGGYGEIMVLEESLVTEVPNGLDTDRAALTEPMAVGAHAVEKARLSGDEVPVVIGCGPVGLAVIASLRLRGVGPIIAADFSATRRGLAEQMGADVVVDPKSESPYDRWQEVSGSGAAADENPFATALGRPLGRPAVLFECVGVPGVIQQLMDGAPRGARIVVVGLCLEPDRIQPFVGVNKELGIQFVLAYSQQEFAATLRAIAEGRIDVDPLITGKTGVGGVAEAFETLSNPEAHAKILVEPWRD
jgi:threonine dehydrogenase-like Zn-dependent dehydrogenase